MAVNQVTEEKISRAINELVAKYNRINSNNRGKQITEKLGSSLREAPTTTALPPPVTEQPVEAQLKLKQILDQVASVAEARHKFPGDYGLKGMKKNDKPVSKDAIPAIRDNKLALTKVLDVVTGIGQVANCYMWKTKPVLDAHVPAEIQNAKVRLPSGMSLAKFTEMRQVAQAAVVTEKGLDTNQQQEFALNLSGITIEATLPYKAKYVLAEERDDVNVHCIFQTGLNLAGVAGGGIPVHSIPSKEDIRSYSMKNAKAALKSAIDNGSDVLVFNIGIGAGFFAGQHKSSVKEANIQTLIEAVHDAPKKIEVVIPNIGFTEAQKKALQEAGIRIISADKDAVTAELAAKGVKVSQTIAADPMSILGIHGPGLWWESAGSASDEERAAYLTPCYTLGHIPIDVYQADATKPERIAAISEFMI